MYSAGSILQSLYRTDEQDQMARPRGRLSESSSSRSIGNDEEAASFIDSSMRSHVRSHSRSISWSHSLKVWLKQVNLADLSSNQSSSPMLCKRIPNKPSENGGAMKDLVEQINVGLSYSKCGPLSLLKWFFISTLMLISALGFSFASSIHFPNVHRGYKHLREEFMAEFLDIRFLSLRAKE